MKLVPMTCPACGAALRVDHERHMASCPHCGCAYFMDDEAEHVHHENGFDFGYDFERGRMRARDEREPKGPPKETQKTPERVVTQTTTPSQARHLTHAQGCLAIVAAFVLLTLLVSSLPQNQTGTSAMSDSLTGTSTESTSAYTTATSSNKKATDSSESSTAKKSTLTPDTTSTAPAVGREEVRSRYDQAKDTLDQDLTDHGSNSAYAAYNEAVEGLWALMQHDIVTEADLSKSEGTIASERQSYLDTAEQIEHEAERKREEQERAEQERIEAERAEQERIANIEASYVDPEVLQVVYGTLDHRSKALDLWNSDLMTYPLCTGSEEYFDAFDDWIRLHEHYELTKKYSTGPAAMGPGDMFYVSDQEMADATAKLCQLRRNMVVSYEIDHPQG